MNYEIRQTICYSYQQPVRQSINQIRLRPLNDEGQSCLWCDIVIVPQSRTYHYLDYWGNNVETFCLWDSHQKLVVQTYARVSVTRPVSPTVPLFTLSMRRAFASGSFKNQYSEYLSSTSLTYVTPGLLHLLTDSLWSSADDPLHYVQQVNNYIYSNMKYVPGSTTVKTTVEEFLNKRQGVCQDFTHLMLSMCRYRGIPARYVSGYVYCGKNTALRGDAATHAWVEVLFPDTGWLGFDPTNNIMVGDMHVCVATGRDYKDIVPMKGVYKGGNQEMTVQVSMHRQEAMQLRSTV